MPSPAETRTVPPAAQQRTHTIDAAIVGLGRWGRRIVEAVTQGATGIRITHAVSTRPDARATLAREHGFALVSNLESVLANPAVSAVLLATPHSLHTQQIVAAARAGKHVFCEKPLALTREDAEAAVRACTRAGRVLAVGHDKRFWPSMRALREVTSSGALGTLMHVEGHSSNENSATVGGWRADPSESPAGGMTGTGVHVLDALVSLAGPVASVSARLTSLRGPPRPLDTVSALMRFAGGASGTLATVRASPLYWRVHAFGDRGSAEALGAGTLVLRMSGAAPERRDWPVEDAVAAELAAFAEAVAGLRPYPVSTAEMLQTVGAFEAIVRSIASGAAARVAAT